jgi:hypothetical protein
MSNAKNCNSNPVFSAVLFHPLSHDRLYIVVWPWRYSFDFLLSAPESLLTSVNMQSDSSTPPPDIQTLQKQIQDLTDVCNKLQTLRQIPGSLLTPTSNDISLIGQTRPEFQRLKGIGDTIRSSPVQEALHRAQNSLGANATGINSNPRRENRKRR